MEEAKNYFAFISYQRKDEEWAEKLRNKLEHYRLPSNVLKQDVSLPKEIRPIFRDALELAGGVLAKEIEMALQSSKFLIVICSPNSARSPWVNKEIQTFIDLGREDRIIPFIIDGMPFSGNEETECFPPALRALKGEKELLGININELSRDAAAVKVVARMFGLKFDTLWQRYEREQKKKRWAMIIGALLTVLVSLGIAGFIYQQNTLLKEKDWKMMENQAKAVAEKTVTLVDEGDSYLARLLALEILPANLENADKPYIPESEYALRKACLHNSAILRGHLDDINSVSFSPDGKSIVSTSNDMTVRIWDSWTGKQISTLKGHSKNVSFASFSSDGRKIISGSIDNTIRLWDVEKGTMLRLWKYTAYTAAFTPDCHKVVAVCGDKTIRTWDIHTGKLLHTQAIEGDYDLISSAAFCTSSLLSTSLEKLVLTTWNNIIHIIDVQTGNQLFSIEGHSDASSSAVFSRGGQFILTVSWGDGIRIWNAQNRPYLIKALYLTDYNPKFNAASFSPNSKLIVSAATDKTVRIWDAISGECLKKLEGHRSSVKAALFSPDGQRIVSASDDKTIRIWDVQIGKEKHLLRESNNELFFLVDFYNNTRQIVSADYGHIICLWDSQTGQCIRKIEANNQYQPRSVSFTYDGQLMAVATEDNTINLWDTKNGKRLQTMVGHKSCINSLAFSPDGRLMVSTSQDESIRIWDIETGACLKTLKIKGWGNSVAFSPDGRYIVSTSNEGTICIWDVKAGQQLRKKGCNDGMASFSPDGKYIISISDNKEIHIWDPHSLEILQKLEGHTDYITSINISPNSNYLVSASSDNTIRIWDIKAGKQLQLLDGQTHVYSASFTPDGKHIISVSRDGTIRLWDFPPLQELIDETRERFKNRPLTLEERKKYYLE